MSRWNRISKRDYSKIVNMEDILPDHRDRKPGRTIYDIVADLKKQRRSPPVQDKIAKKSFYLIKFSKSNLKKPKKHFQRVN